MKVMVTVPDNVAAEAEARGLSVETYVEQLLGQRIQPREPLHKRTPEEIRAWIDAFAQFSDKIPPLPETITREWIYQDHD